MPIISVWLNVSLLRSFSKPGATIGGGDHNALEALVRFGDEELEHQALFRRVDAVMGQILPPGYRLSGSAKAAALAAAVRSCLGVRPV